MHVSSLKLINFRNYRNETIVFHQHWNVLIGVNGSGKTNILEALYFLSTAKSPRAAQSVDLITWGEQTLFIEGRLSGMHQSGVLSHALDREGNRSLIFDGAKKKSGEITGLIPFVFFVPEDLLLIKGDALKRRNMLNFLLMQMYPHYRFMFLRLSHTLRARNACLKRISEGRDNPSYLEEWNEALIKTGLKICNKRKEIIKELNFYLKDISCKIFNGEGRVELVYKNFMHDDYGEELTEENYRSMLEKKQTEELRYRNTLCGPNKDELIFLFKGNDLRKFGSQGQQRAAILALKYATFEVLKQHWGESPIIIFDDVFSELDIAKRNALINLLHGEAQVFVTATALDVISDTSSYGRVLHIKDGSISKDASIV
ncbi:MAG: DNA replication and repair protein RecF [Elusimicrobiota bacterium]